MGKSLEQARIDWEKTLEPKSVLSFEWKTVVILYDEKDKTYRIHRYFLLGSDWTCSVDKQDLSLDELFEALEYHIE